MNHSREEAEEIFYKWKSMIRLTNFYGPFTVNTNILLVLKKMLQEFFCKQGVPYDKTAVYCDHTVSSWGEFIVKNNIRLYSAESMQKFSHIVMQSLGHK